MDKTLEKRIILGIDPGTNVMGYGVVIVERRSIKMLAIGDHHISSPFDGIDKLHQIYNHVNALITRYTPTEMAIESPFYGRNVQSMLKLGRAQGVSISAGLNAGLRVVEYSPKKIKKSITGNGNASKEQVAALLRHFVDIDPITGGHSLDATDALAVAICHSLQGSLGAGGRRFKDWKSFASRNSDRVR